MNWCCLQTSTTRKNEELKGYHIFLEDGTEVDDNDYFNILPSQSLLIISEQTKLSTACQSEMGSLKNGPGGKLSNNINI